MRKYFLLLIIFTNLLVKAQQISFQRNYPKGDNAYITTFTELKSREIIVGYSLIKVDTTLVGPHTLELHLMKTDRNGNELWDKLVVQDTTRFEADRYTIQNIDEQNDGSLVLDITHPYGEKYLRKYNANGDQLWESYLNNSLGDYNIYGQLLKERGRNLVLNDGSVIVAGNSIVSITPKATLSFVDANGLNAVDQLFYNGYFNDAYYYNFEHIYTVGVEQAAGLENLVFSDLKTDGAVNYHKRTPHKVNEKILATSLLYTNKGIRVAESVSKKDTAFYVNVYDYNHSGVLLSVVSHKIKCAAVTLTVAAYEVNWVLSNQCKTESSQTIEKMESLNRLAFSFSDTFDSVISLRKLRDENYLFCFSKGSGINLWKINSRGTLQNATVREGYFAPNPAKNYVNFIGNSDTYNHQLSIKIYDMLGHTLKELTFEKLEPVHIDLSGLREGIYIYNLLTDENIELKGKIVIDQLN